MHLPTASFILNNQEKIDNNLGSRQISDVLDTLLMAALQPLCESTNAAKVWVADVLNLMVEGGKRRKFSVCKDNDEVIDALTNSLFDNSVFPKVEDCYLERGLPFHFINTVINTARRYPYVLLKTREGDMDAAKDLYAISMSLHGVSGKHFYSALAQSRYFFSHYQQFKWDVVHKYHKFAYKQAVFQARTSGQQYDIDDLFINNIMFISKAIDKFSPMRGVLTPFVEKWLKSSAGDFSPEYGTAFSLPAYKKKQLASEEDGAEFRVKNIAYSLDDAAEVRDASDPMAPEEDLHDLHLKLSCITYIPCVATMFQSHVIPAYDIQAGEYFRPTKAKSTNATPVSQSSTTVK